MTATAYLGLGSNLGDRRGYLDRAVLPDADRFMLHLYAALAEKERAMISRRTKDALAAKKAQGETLGGLRAHGAQAREDAIERAEQLRPVLTELAGKSARKWPPLPAATVIRVQKRLGLG